jgi:hypothetical protein
MADAMTVDGVTDRASSVPHARPVRLCCAMAQLAQAFARRVPPTETELALTGTLCDCAASQHEETRWHLMCGAP